MPRRSLRACSRPGCPNLVRRGRCEDHEKQMQQEYDSQRGSSAQRGYGARWQRLRQIFLNANPLCADPFCLHANNGEIIAAIEVDHIVPKRHGGTDIVKNLQALCKPCHSRKTAEENNTWGRGVSISGASAS